MIPYKFKNKNEKGGMGARRQMNCKNQNKKMYQKMYIKNKYERLQSTISLFLHSQLYFQYLENKTMNLN